MEQAPLRNLLVSSAQVSLNRSYKTYLLIVPDPKKCLTIIGPTTTDGVRALNVEFDTEEEVNKWVEYLEIVINYFRKNQTIRNAVVIKKNG